MKKILFYINTLGNGGAERVVANLSSRLSEKYDVTLVNSFALDSEYPVSDRVARRFLDEKQVKSRIARNLGRIRALRRVIKEVRPDVTVSFMEEPNFRMLLAARGIKTRKIVSVRNDPSKEYPGLFGKLIAKFLLPRADGCVFQTEEAKAWFPRRLQKKSTVIMNAVGERFFDAPKAEEHRGIVTCGRLAKQKNHALLIDAYAKIKDCVDDPLYIYGKGPLENELSEKIAGLGLSDRVFLMGQTDDVIPPVSRAKLFVLSSDYEGMPNALMEALSLGVACLSTDCPCGGPRGLIEDGKNGVLVPTGDVEALAERMKEICRNDTLRASLGASAKEASLRFRPEAVTREWEEYLLYGIQ